MAWRKRIRSLFHWQRLEADLDEELQYHLEMRARDNRASGMSAAEARIAAIKAFGNRASIREQTRDKWGWRFLERLGQDLRYAARGFSRSSGFTTIAIITIALGIGATTAIFSVVNAVMLRPLPFRDPDRIVWVLTDNTNTNPLPGGGVGPPRISLRLDDFHPLRDQARTLSNLSMFSPVPANYALTGIEEPVYLTGTHVSAELFPLLGVPPILGRVFEPEEATVANDRFVVLSEAMWERQFGRDPDIQGRLIVLNDNPYEVTGVMPASFAFPDSATQFWAPLPIPSSPDPFFTGRPIARITDGFSLEEATAEFQAIFRGLHPGERPTEFEGPDISLSVRLAGADVHLVPIQEELIAPVRPALLVLLGAVGFVLLIASANVASLLLSRASGRRLEMAIRVALGAGRMRVIRQILTESLVLGITGGVVGTFLAYGGVRVLKAIQPGTIPRIDEIAVDSTTLVFALGVSMLTSILFGLAPAFRLASHARVDTLKEGSLFASSGFGLFGRNRVRSLLAILAVSSAVVLLIGGGLLIGSFANLANIDPGYDTENVLTFQLGLPETRYPEFLPREALYDELLERIRNMNGVVSAGGARLLPLAPGPRVVFGMGEPPNISLLITRTVTPGYFETMGIDLLEGRDFEDQERPDVVMVNETFARQFFPEGAIGREFNVNRGESVRLQIIGVVGDIQDRSLTAEVVPVAYQPYHSLSEMPPFMANTPLMLAVHTSVDPLNLLAQIRTTVLDLDSSLPLDNVMTMEQRVSSSIAEPRFYSVIMGVFAGIALILASVGIYGLLSYSATQRTREIGIRIALGAGRGSVLNLILTQAMVLTAIGIVIGLAGAFGLTRYLESMLFGLTSLDTVTIVGMTSVLVLAAMLACYVPARRATRVDPITALRHD